MNIPALIPWTRRGARTPAPFGDSGRDPFLALHRDVNRLFDEALRGFATPVAGTAAEAGADLWPNVEIVDGDSEIRVMAEVPGMEEKDIEVLLDDNTLTLLGERVAETEDSERRFSERFYGRFERRIPLGYDIEQDNVRAEFRNGVLTVTLPKSEQARSKARRVQISSA
jgi:HSP20 family protein